MQTTCGLSLKCKGTDAKRRQRRLINPICDLSQSDTVALTQKVAAKQSINTEQGAEHSAHHISQSRAEQSTRSAEESSEHRGEERAQSGAQSCFGGAGAIHGKAERD